MPEADQPGKLAHVLIEHGEQHGAPEMSIPIYYELEDGKIVRGEATEVREQIRIVRGRPTLVRVDPLELE